MKAKTSSSTPRKGLAEIDTDSGLDDIDDAHVNSGWQEPTPPPICQHPNTPLPPNLTNLPIPTITTTHHHHQQVLLPMPTNGVRSRSPFGAAGWLWLPTVSVGI